jgi:hypothetical protein
MNKSFALFSAAAYTLAVISCTSAKQQPVSADTYSEQQATKITSSDATQASAAAAESDPYNDDKIKGKKTLSQQILGTDKWIKVDKTSLFVADTFGQLKQRTGFLIYKPQTDLAGFQVRYDTSLYNFYMAENDRRMFIDAVNSYLADFEAKKLIRNSGKTKKIYGEAGGYEEFGLVEIMMPNVSKPGASFGYKFIRNSPYFCIRIDKSPNIAENLGTNKVPESIDQYYYFTKSQAKSLADFLTDENLAKVSAAYGSEDTSADQSKDAY